MEFSNLLLVDSDHLVSTKDIEGYIVLPFNNLLDLGDGCGASIPKKSIPTSSGYLVHLCQFRLPIFGSCLPCFLHSPLQLVPKERRQLVRFKMAGTEQCLSRKALLFQPHVQITSLSSFLGALGYM